MEVCVCVRVYCLQERCDGDESQWNALIVG
jgi:hypothetical protein